MKINYSRIYYFISTKKKFSYKTKNHSFYEIEIQSDYSLSGWFHLKGNKFKTILFFHGNSGNLENRIDKLNKLNTKNIKFSYKIGFVGRVKKD